jgi:hypothetical protein
MTSPFPCEMGSASGPDPLQSHTSGEGSAAELKLDHKNDAPGADSAVEQNKLSVPIAENLPDTEPPAPKRRSTYVFDASFGSSVAEIGGVAFFVALSFSSAVAEALYVRPSLELALLRAAGNPTVLCLMLLLFLEIFCQILWGFTPLAGMVSAVTKIDFEKAASEKPQQSDLRPSSSRFPVLFRPKVRIERLLAQWTLAAASSTYCRVCSCCFLSSYLLDFFFDNIEARWKNFGILKRYFDFESHN